MDNQLECCLESTAVEEAKRIMGSNLVGISDLDMPADKPFSQEDIDFFSTVPFAEGLLEKCQHSHILVPGLKMSVLDAYLAAPAVHFLFDSDPWWIEEDFATKQKTKRKWYLIRRAVVPESIGKPYDEQIQIVKDKSEDVPRGCELICAIIFYYLVTGIRLFEKIKSHCSDISIDGVHFHVGFFQKGHIDVRGYSDPVYLRDVGITGMQKADLDLVP